MKTNPKIGVTHEQTFVVEAHHLVDFAGEGMPAVLCTPALVGFLERTARLALLPVLEPGENSVGTDIEISHLAPTPAGQTVTCRARTVHAEGPKVTFHLEARDEQELIARGMHTRRVIREERFAQAVRRKAASR